MHIFINEICAKTVPSNGVIWEEFIKQHQHQSTKKAAYSLNNLLFWCKKGAN